MAIRWMVTEGTEGAEVVTNYPGHEVGSVIHGYRCPRGGTVIAGPCEPELECRFSGPLYMKTDYVGLVLALRERNGYDDSDFLALVWDDVKGAPVEHEYASTRGWTYPNGAVVDATPDVVAKWEAWKSARAAEARAARVALEAKTPRLGKTVRVVRGRKVPIGTVGVVAWVGEDRFARPSRYAHPLAGLLRTVPAGGSAPERVGLSVNGASKLVFTAATNVEVVAAEAVTAS